MSNSYLLIQKDKYIQSFIISQYKSKLIAYAYQTYNVIMIHELNNKLGFSQNRHFNLSSSCIKSVHAIQSNL